MIEEERAKKTDTQYGEFYFTLFLERQEYLFIAVKRNEAGDRKK